MREQGCSGNFESVSSVGKAVKWPDHHSGPLRAPSSHGLIFATAVGPNGRALSQRGLFPNLGLSWNSPCLLSDFFGIHHLFLSDFSLLELE